MMKLPFENQEREILIKQEATTSKDFGVNPNERKIEDYIQFGIVNINKPQGPSSHQISDYVKKILGLKKAGHSGSLDPNVTGVLPIALGKATRVVQTLLNAGKEYVCIMHLHDDIPEDKIRDNVKHFVGKIEQMPPIRSAVKRQLRTREIYYFEILEVEGRDVLFRVGCEAGTYIRKLCTDFGKKLDTGAHMAELIRTKAGPFQAKDWVTLHDLKDAYESWKESKDEILLRKFIQPMEKAVEHLPKIWIVDSAIDSIAHGAHLHVPGVAKLEAGIEVGDMVAIMSLKDELVSLGKAAMNSQNILMQERGLVSRDQKVFMEEGVYPKFVKEESKN